MAKIVEGIVAELVAVDKFSVTARKVSKSSKEVSSSFSGISKTAGAVGAAMKKAMPFLAGAASIGGIYKLAKGILDTGMAFETMQFQLRGVSDSIAEADSQFQMIRKFAYDTPHLTEDVTRAFIMLKAVGLAPTIDKMRIFGDAAFAMGRNIIDVSQAIVSLETEVLRRLGVRIDRTGKMAIVESGNIRYEVVNDLDAIREKVIEVWEKRFKGAMEGAAETSRGSVLIMKSAFSELQKALSDFILTPFSNATKKITEFAEKLRQATAEIKMEFGIKLPDREHLEARIEAIKREIKGLEEIVGSATGRTFSWWSSLNQAFMGKGGVEEGRKRVAELRAELRLYSQMLSQIVQQEEQSAKNKEEEAKRKKELAEAERERNRTITEQVQLQGFITDRTGWGLHFLEEYRQAEDMLIKIEKKRNEALDEQLQLQGLVIEKTGWGKHWLDEWGEAADRSFKKSSAQASEFGNVLTSQVGYSLRSLASETAKAGDIMKNVLVDLTEYTMKYVVATLLARKAEAGKGGMGGFGWLGIAFKALSGLLSLFAGPAGAVYTVAGGALALLHEGGLIGEQMKKMPKAHRGLLIGGGSHEIPILAKPNEYVISERGVRAAGVPALDRINRGDFNVGGVSMVNNFAVTNLADIDEVGRRLAESVMSTLRES